MGTNQVTSQVNLTQFPQWRQCGDVQVLVDCGDPVRVVSLSSRNDGLDRRLSAVFGRQVRLSYWCPIDGGKFSAELECK
jgi:hypothetical protein